MPFYANANQSVFAYRKQLNDEYAGYSSYIKNKWLILRNIRKYNRTFTRFHQWTVRNNLARLLRRKRNNKPRTHYKFTRYTRWRDRV